MRAVALAVAVLVASAAGALADHPLREFLECQLCETQEPHGLVKDCSCDFQTVNHAASEFFAPLLEQLQERTFFRIFKINLEKGCPFWPDNFECFLQDCSVCECEPDEIPRTWLESPDGLNQQDPSSITSHAAWITSAGNHSINAQRQHLERVDRSEARAGESFREWRTTNENSWIEEDDDTEHMVYINLLKNPERFTGYSGESARRVWNAIHQENCFGGDDDVCFEKRVFYRLMSGLQASISTHIAREYYWPETGWGTNIPLFVKAVGSHPDRLHNLYFTFLVLLRALSKAQDALLTVDYNTGNPQDDQLTRELMRKLLTAPVPEADDSTPSHWRDAAEMCRKGFDESHLFQVEHKPTDANYLQELEEKEQLKNDLREKFRNISRIMDCVGCEKCRLWGKLQTLGIGTAVKILLTDEEELIGNLERNEVIALVNTVGQLAKSVKFAANSRDMEFEQVVMPQMKWPAVVASSIGLVGAWLAGLRRRQSVAARSS